MTKVFFISVWKSLFRSFGACPTVSPLRLQEKGGASKWPGSWQGLRGAEEMGIKRGSQDSRPVSHPDSGWHHQGKLTLTHYQIFLENSLLVKESLISCRKNSPLHCRNLVSLTIFLIFFLYGNNSCHYGSLQTKVEPCGIKIWWFFLYKTA